MEVRQNVRCCLMTIKAILMQLKKLDGVDKKCIPPKAALAHQNLQQVWANWRTVIIMKMKNPYLAAVMK